MRKILTFGALLAALAFLPTGGFAADPEDVAKHPSCKYCGMNRGMLGHSRMVIEYVDGTSEGLCSLHCAALEFGVAMGRTPKILQVGDYNTKELIDAESAQWILGGDRAAVMSRRAKWAFRTPEAAQAFAKEHGGETVSFEQSMRAAYEDMYEDTKTIRERRKMRRMQESPKEGHGGR